MGAGARVFLLALHLVIGCESTDACEDHASSLTCRKSLLQKAFQVTEAEGRKLTTTAAKKGGPKLILVSGGEGCGTTMVTQILSEASNVLGIPTDWTVDELSTQAQEKYSSSILSHFVTARQDPFDSLWKDASRSYILKAVDERESETKAENFAKAVEYLNYSLQQARQVDTFVYHRSMPFGTRDKTPFLEDLPALAKQLGNGGSAHLVLVIRSQPASWLSHASPDDYMAFLKRVEQLVAGNFSVNGLSVSVLSYEQLLCDPTSALTDVASELGLDLASLLESPQLKHSDSTVHRHDDDEAYQAKLVKFTEQWESVRHMYPTYDEFQHSHADLCNESA
eukprot:CAMPEP_0197664186 /NCGR_PEP_ID=MMETSP1338-20131121/58481_1 /TAXON_ID=43686 ORGANISM="Pelagodinium beii, Strain RCC1491" /NCGR_SAMPLE_ID=MMETSP1338 /ASSEMBLY_ACC=CAM_ASM_000754 /LENGTH=337 /DNA_ID=CAMNT_0043242769 /DNA_START=43 /DNA_END=1056 /DNA_ORIENTATION=-